MGLDPFVSVTQVAAAIRLRQTSATETLEALLARLRAAGAVIVGKINVPPLSADFRADNPIFGRTNNPWNLGHMPGGSTGGGAAVAAGLSYLDIGSDIAGSVCIPSTWCGGYGIKPSEHRVPGTACTCVFKITGHPVMSMPGPVSGTGLPIGVQLVGRRWGDVLLLAFAAAVSVLIGPFHAPPGFAA